MSLLQQTIQLLSETPGNIIYHLITLFALQAVFAISYGQWRRNDADSLAARTAWAAGIIFLARVGLLFTGMALQDYETTAVAILPPLEQAIHSLTAVFITWSLAAQSTRYPRLGQVLLALALVVIGVMTFSFIQTWPEQATLGEAYNSSQQATMWGIFQLGILGLGLLVILARNQFRFSLSAIIISLLLVAHVAHFGNYPEIIDTPTNVAYWIRLGHLIVFPLWAALAYRRSLAAAIHIQQTQQLATDEATRSLALAADVIRSLEEETAVSSAIAMAAKMSGATFVGLALVNPQKRLQLYLSSNQPQTKQDKPRSWYLNLADWPAFRQALEQQEFVILRPEGIGARQLHEWYSEMGIVPLGDLFIQPLMVHNDGIGLLLLAGPLGRPDWQESEQQLIRSLAGYLARAIDNGRYLTQARQQPSDLAALEQPSDTAVSGRILALEEERDQLRSELNTTISRLQQAETRAVNAAKQVNDLAATLNEIDHINRDEHTQTLEAEIDALRESLIDAEEAMALAAASESELSTEWVMLTITRYSGQLEEAQERIEQLEKMVTPHKFDPANELVSSLVQELRTPMTSIAGYTDILLAERIGILGAKQREFVQRVQANAARMNALLEQIVQLTTGVEPTTSQLDHSLVNVEDAVETAVTAIITQVREKNLRLELTIPSDLPLLPIERNAMRQIIVSLLGNACLASRDNGRVAVTVRTNSIPLPDNTKNNGQSDPFQFIHLAITDSGGGIRVADRSRVFDPQHEADSPLIAGLGDTGAALSMSRSLAEANGGRIWVDSIMGVGSTFSALFPISRLEPVKDSHTLNLTLPDTLPSKGNGTHNKPRSGT